MEAQVQQAVIARVDVGRVDVGQVSMGRPRRGTASGYDARVAVRSGQALLPDLRVCVGRSSPSTGSMTLPRRARPARNGAGTPDDQGALTGIGELAAQPSEELARLGPLDP
ncbi:hypothetical protein ACI79C_18325 [Geodermatophilus sp. SYSU D00697]